MHVEDIATRISSAPQYNDGQQTIDPNKLSEYDPSLCVAYVISLLDSGHILRLLATHHITREVRPNVFANNRISSVIDSGKSWKDIIALDE